MEELKYYIFECNLTDLEGKTLDERVRFCCSSLRWLSLKKEIEQGEKLLDINTLEKVYETKDRNKARSMATEF